MVDGMCKLDVHVFVYLYAMWSTVLFAFLYLTINVNLCDNCQCHWFYCVLPGLSCSRQIEYSAIRFSFEWSAILLCNFFYLFHVLSRIIMVCIAIPFPLTWCLYLDVVVT